MAIERWENEGGRTIDPEVDNTLPSGLARALKMQRRRNLTSTVEGDETGRDLNQAWRDEVVELLNQLLADAIDLHGQAKQAHWNVKGPQFQQLHELFDVLAKQVNGYVDSIAERATTLGGTALGTVRIAASRSRLAEYPADARGGMQHIAALATRFAALATTTRSAIEAADTVTADLLTEITRGLDKSVWILESHLQA